MQTQYFYNTNVRTVYKGHIGTSNVVLQGRLFSPWKLKMYYSGTCLFRMPWDRPQKTVLIIEVSLFHRFVYTHLYCNGTTTDCMSLIIIEVSLFQSVHNSRFECSTMGKGP